MAQLFLEIEFQLSYTIHTNRSNSVIRNFLLFLLLIFTGAFLAVKFSPSASATLPLATVLPAWTLSDVRLLDPADAAPTLDLAAAYLRPSGPDLDLRLDFLDSAALPDYDLMLALDTRRGGAYTLPNGAYSDLEWDMLLLIPARGPLRLLDDSMQPIRGAGMRVLRDPTLDALTVHLSGLPGSKSPARLQVFTLPAGSTTIADQSAPTPDRSGALRPARLGLAFTNVFPAYSPASALRRWQGAHTGPLGESHGLGPLLQAANQYGAPLALKDLDRPEALAALDAVGGLALVAEMEQQEQLVLLADPLSPFEPSKELAKRFDLHPVEIGLQPTGRLRVMGMDEPLQLEEDRPSLALRRAVIEAALAENTSGLPTGEAPALILGGELPNSAWGDGSRARTALRYLKSRPWIRFLSPEELIETLPPVPAGPDPRFAPALPAAEQAELLAALQAAPENSLGLAARQAYAALFAPVYPAPAQLPQLRASYTGVVWSLIYAAAWAEDPQPRLDCNVDPDRDGQAECLLADERRYAQLEVESGVLSYLFSRDGQGGHQWIGPSAQFITGTGNALMWDPTRGLLADMAVIPGALYDTVALPGEPMKARIENGGIILFKDALPYKKIFALQDDGLRIDYPADEIAYAWIPISLTPDPWQRFAPGWAQQYTWKRSGNGQVVSITTPEETTTVVVRSNCPLEISTFQDSLQWLVRPENPDREYPRGHYLPFPLFLLECKPGGQTKIIFEIGEP